MSAATTIWDQIDSILTTKSDVFDSETYNPWIVNVALSHHLDTVLIANEMNRCSHLPTRAQYDFYRGAARKARRPRQKWLKAEKSERLDLISRAYECNNNRAREYSKIISDEQLEMIRLSLSEGGKE